MLLTINAKRTEVLFKKFICIKLCSTFGAIDPMTMVLKRTFPVLIY